MRGGKELFTVEAKSFEIMVEESGKKLRGRIWKRGRGLCSWIRFGEYNLKRLLEGVEAVEKEGRKIGWKSF